MTDDRNFIWSSRREQNCDESSTAQRAFIDLNQSGWPRIQMFQLAADYERKAKAAEALEESLRNRYTADASLAPKTPEAFEDQPKEPFIGKK